MSSFPFSVVGPQIVAASTIKATHFIHHVTGSGMITTIEPPADGFTGPVIFIGDTENEGPELAQSEAGNIAGYTAVGFKLATVMVFDGAIWYPNRSA